MNSLNKTLIIKKNQSEALSPCTEYEKILAVINYLESLENEEIEILSYSLPKEGFREKNIIDYFYSEARKKEAIRVKKDESN